jgi:hypothetical protein
MIPTMYAQIERILEHSTRKPCGRVEALRMAKLATDAAFDQGALSVSEWKDLTGRRQQLEDEHASKAA